MTTADLNAQLDHFLIAFALFTAVALVVRALGIAVRRYHGPRRPGWVVLATRVLALINPPRAEFRREDPLGQTVSGSDNMGQMALAAIVLAATALVLLGSA